MVRSPEHSALFFTLTNPPGQKETRYILFFKVLGLFVFFFLTLTEGEYTRGGRTRKEKNGRKVRNEKQERTKLYSENGIEGSIGQKSTEKNMYTSGSTS